MKKEIYFIDDEEAVRNAIARALHRSPFKAEVFEDATVALGKLEPNWNGVVLTDLNMPIMDGFQVIEEVKKIDPQIPVIVLTGNGEKENILKSFRAGAYDFLEKPLMTDYLLKSATRALEHRSLSLENKSLRSQLKAQHDKGGFLGKTQIMQDLLKSLEAVAPTDANILITGETGSGKEMVARQIHLLSHRKKQSFVALNCGAVPDSLMDSELFGHEAGAFTGANSQRIGKVELANKGTLFLDEVNSMPLSMQVKFLRVLQERVIERLGNNELLPVDVRLVAASQVDLFDLSKSGEFREDLYYRLNVIPVQIPPLRQRKEDIPMLFQHFLVQSSEKYNLDLKDLSEQHRGILFDYDWPGNVRELQNCAERFALTGTLQIKGASQASSGFQLDDGAPLPEQVNAFERSLLEKALRENKGKIDETYKALSIPRKTLYDKMKKYSLAKEDFKD